MRWSASTSSHAVLITTRFGACAADTACAQSAIPRTFPAAEPTLIAKCAGAAIEPRNACAAGDFTPGASFSFLTLWVHAALRDQRSQIADETGAACWSP